MNRLVLDTDRKDNEISQETEKLLESMYKDKDYRLLY